MTNYPLGIKQISGVRTAYCVDFFVTGNEPIQKSARKFSFEPTYQTWHKVHMPGHKTTCCGW